MLLRPTSSREASTGGRLRQVGGGEVGHGKLQTDRRVRVNLADTSVKTGRLRRCRKRYRHSRSSQAFLQRSMYDLLPYRIVNA